MGDTITTTLLTRYERGVLWSKEFENLFESVTFNNGGMRFKHINFHPI